MIFQVQAEEKQPDLIARKDIVLSKAFLAC
jgi:hypothetical protein